MAPVQPGNSGGPLVDTHGTLVRIIVSKLNGLRVARVTGSIPENINFAVRADLARALLGKNGIKYAVSPSDVALTTPDVAAKVFKFTAMVQCFR
jgi:S1-C subfamily serine protease